MKSYTIPRTLNNVSTNLNTTFMIINNEFHNQTSLSGFTLYGALNGSIKIQDLTFIKIINFK